MTSRKAKRPSSTYVLEPARPFFLLVVVGQALLAIGVIATVYLSPYDLVTGLMIYSLATSGSVMTIGALLLLWDNAIVKTREAARLVREFPWGGDEIVAEVGCGKGWVMSSVAQRMTRGVVIGVDSLGTANGTARDLKAMIENPVKGETIVGAANADRRTLPLRGEAFDMVISGFGAKRFRQLADRIFELEEAVRVLKPGGRIFALVRGNPAETSVLLEGKGLVEVTSRRIRRQLLSSGQVVSGRKLTQF